MEKWYQITEKFFGKAVNNTITKEEAKSIFAAVEIELDAQLLESIGSSLSYKEMYEVYKKKIVDEIESTESDSSDMSLDESKTKKELIAVVKRHRAEKRKLIKIIMTGQADAFKEKLSKIAEEDLESRAEEILSFYREENNLEPISEID